MRATTEEAVSDTEGETAKVIMKEVLKENPRII